MNAGEERLGEFVVARVRHRILDLAPPGRAKLTGKLRNWHELDFATFRKEVKPHFASTSHFGSAASGRAIYATTPCLSGSCRDQIASAEREIDRIVYGLFELTPREISLLEASLREQPPIPENGAEVHATPPPAKLARRLRGRGRVEKISIGLRCGLECRRCRHPITKTGAWVIRYPPSGALSAKVNCISVTGTKSSCSPSTRT